MIWWRHIDDNFSISSYDEELLKVFTDQVNMFHPTIKFTAEYFFFICLLFVFWNMNTVLT